MAPDPPRSASAEEVAQLAVAQLSKRLEMLDGRLDNLDSMVTAVVERVMKHTLTLEMSCPHCGRHLQAAVIGQIKQKV